MHLFKKKETTEKEANPSNDFTIVDYLYWNLLAFDVNERK